MNESAVLKKLAKPLILLATLVWGSSFFVMKNTLDHVPVFFLLAIRFTIAALILFVIFFRNWKSVDRWYVRSGAVMGTLLFLAYTVQTFGLEQTSSGNNAFLTAVYCVIVPFLYWGISHQRPDRYNLLAAVLCIAGIGLVSLNGSLTMNIGDVLTLGSGLAYALHIVAVARFSQGKDVFLLTTLQFAFTALWAWIFVLLTGGFPTAALPLDAVWRLGYLAVFATAGALLFQNIGQKYTAPATAAVLLALEAPFGVLFAVLFDGERPTVQMLVGFVLIFLSVLCSETKFAFLQRKKVDTAAENE